MNIDYDSSTIHREDCDAVKMVEEGEWGSPWTFARAKIGIFDKKEKNFVDRPEIDLSIEGPDYVVVKCLDPECSASLKVETMDLLEDLPHEVEPVE